MNQQQTVEQQQWQHRHASVVAIGCLFVLLAIGSCGSGVVGTETDVQDHVLPAPVVSYPAFPTDERYALPVVRAVSGVVDKPGSSFAEQSSDTASYSPSTHPDSYVLVPADGNSIAWAHYHFSGVTGDRPISATIMTADAAALEGGAILPHVMWVGVADYTTYSWEWYGPLSGSTTLTLNVAAAGEAQAKLDRYVSAAGGVHIVVLTDASQVTTTPGNPDGLAAVRVDSVSITTDPAYLQNLPHWPGLTYTGIGSGSKGAAQVDGKQTLALRPEQFAYLEWQHVPAFDSADEVNAADAYVITRQGPLDEQPEVVFSGIASQFVDPLNLIAGVESAKGGTQYTYRITAINEAGATPPDREHLLVPILAPRSLTATVNNTEQDGVVLGWLAADGAVNYEIYRGESSLGSLAELIATVPGGQLTYLDDTAPVGQERWYFVRAVGIGDGDEENGREVGQISNYSLGDRGLRAVQLTISCATAGVSGNGSAGDPFMLSAGETYQFRAVDQNGRDYTDVAQWSVAPTEAASFAVSPPGQLEGIAVSAGAFTITATYNYLAYSWQADAECNAP